MPNPWKACNVLLTPANVVPMQLLDQEATLKCNTRNRIRERFCENPVHNFCVISTSTAVEYLYVIFVSLWNALIIQPYSVKVMEGGCHPYSLKVIKGQWIMVVSLLTFLQNIFGFCTSSHLKSGHPVEVSILVPKATNTGWTCQSS
jgi:hypothetical protein